MRRMIFISVVCAFLTAPAMAELISFVDGHPLSGVDGFVAPATYQGDAWSTGDSTVTLGQSYSLLGGNATVSGHENGSAADLSHRLTRGLGVNTGSPEADEVDSISGVEHIDIDFASPYVINYVEVRSLFNPDEDSGTEVAEVQFWLGGALVDTQYIQGAQAFGSGDGTASLQDLNILADLLKFYAPLTAFQNEFAVAQLNVQAVPVPGAVLLGLLGLAAAGRKLRKMC